MLVLHTLIHSLAKEEKRLYYLHGRKSRFIHIYEGYLLQTEFDKGLDRKIFQKDYSSFSRAFFSMQKNALLEDILAVLLEYSNSSSPAFQLSRISSKFEVLFHKGYYTTGLDYLKNCLKICKENEFHNKYEELLKVYLEKIALSGQSSWENYQWGKSELEEVRKSIEELRPKQELKSELLILIGGGKNKNQKEELFPLASERIESYRVLIDQDLSDSGIKSLFELECEYSRVYEDPNKLHQRLISLEKKYNVETTSLELRLELVVKLMESGMDCGDFLLISGLIYKTSKFLETVKNKTQLSEYHQFLYLSGLFYFYENDLTFSQRDLKTLVSLQDVPDDLLIKWHLDLASIQIAANLPQAARDTLNTLIDVFPQQTKQLSYKILSMVILVESNQGEKALNLITRIKNNIKAGPMPRKFSGERLFLETTSKVLRKKKVKYSPISSLEGDWTAPLKLDLWLRAKIENNFYYNHILGYWQDRKKVR